MSVRVYGQVRPHILPVIGGMYVPTQHRERPYRLPHELRDLAEYVHVRHHALILVLGVPGLRFGEAAALQRADIDVIRGTIRVSKSVSESYQVGVGGRIEVKPPKNGNAQGIYQAPGVGLEPTTNGLTVRQGPMR
jgi:integrase